MMILLWIQFIRLFSCARARCNVRVSRFERMYNFTLDSSTLGMNYSIPLKESGNWLKMILLFWLFGSETLRKHSSRIVFAHPTIQVHSRACVYVYTLTDCTDFPGNEWSKNGIHRIPRAWHLSSTPQQSGSRMCSLFESVASCFAQDPWFTLSIN